MEIFYAMVLQMAPAFFIAGALFMLVAVGAMFFSFSDDCDDKDKGSCWIGSVTLGIFALFLLAGAAIPSPTNMFELRIGLLKYYAASPENLREFSKKGLPHLERIVKKIECQYLGCDDKKKE